MRFADLKRRVRTCTGNEPIIAMDGGAALLLSMSETPLSPFCRKVAIS